MLHRDMLVEIRLEGRGKVTPVTLQPDTVVAGCSVLSQPGHIRGNVVTFVTWISDSLEIEKYIFQRNNQLFFISYLYLIFILSVELASLSTFLASKVHKSISVCLPLYSLPFQLKTVCNQG